MFVIYEALHRSSDVTRINEEQVDHLSTGCDIILHSSPCAPRDDALLTNEALCVICLFFFMCGIYSLVLELHASFLLMVYSDSKLTCVRFMFWIYLRILFLNEQG
jgi:hypothetical protein